MSKVDFDTIIKEVASELTEKEVDIVSEQVIYMNHRSSNDRLNMIAYEDQ